MPWTIITLKKAEKSLAAIPGAERAHLEAAIDRLSQGPYDCGLDVQPLRGRPDWRLRVGRWRVLFRVDGERITVTVISVKPRGDAYK